VIWSFAFHEKELSSVVRSVLFILFFLQLNQRKILGQQIFGIFSIKSFFQRNKPIELRFASNLLELILESSIVSISIDYIILS